VVGKERGGERDTTMKNWPYREPCDRVGKKKKELVRRRDPTRKVQEKTGNVARVQRKAHAREQ